MSAVDRGIVGARALTGRDPRTAAADRLAAELFDRAIVDAGLTTKDVAALLGVSVTVVYGMRSTEDRTRVSLTQLVRLPPAFHIALQHRLNAHFGFTRAALLELLEAAGSLAFLEAKGGA
jgi:hypothetical protein